MDIRGKAAVVTGATRGVGRATALMLARGGCSVLVNYSASKAEAEEVAQAAIKLGAKAVPFQCDVHNDAQCRAMMDFAAKTFGRLDVLVNNAGTTKFIAHSDLDGVTDETWDRILGVNLRGPFYCVRAARPHMERSGGGAVVNVTSVAGVAGIGSSVPYCASKAALNNLTVTLARALGPKIRVNAVAPGFIEGEWLKQGFGARYAQVKAANESRSVTGRVSQPDDIAAAIMSFITGSEQVTGQVLTVDGGYLIGPKIS
jgi:3-oxoacyl-[acyl-carrier protein] reductase